MTTTSTCQDRPLVDEILFAASTAQRDRGQEREVIVTRVGRRWCYFRPVGLPDVAEGRFNLLDPRWPMDCPYSFTLRVWRSREAWLSWVVRERALDELRRLLQGYEPDSGVTIADVHEAAHLLGLRDKLLAAAMEGKP